MVGDRKVDLEKVDTMENVADALTKLVRISKFKWCASSMGLGVHDSQLSFVSFGDTNNL